MPFNPTTSTWSQIANEQSYEQATAGNLNSTEFPLVYDPVYNKLVEQISYTMYRKLRVIQNWSNLGRTAPENAYPGILREVYMSQRKGQNYPMDNGTRPTQLNCYDIYDDTIDVRYHSAQFRWLFPWTIYDEELRRFSGGGPEMITQLTEMKMINAINARNLFMDNLRKQVLHVFIENVPVEYDIDIDVSDFTTLTSDNAKAWLNEIDNLIFQLYIGTAMYNGTGNYMQTPKSDLQMIIRRDYWLNIIRKAFPDTYNTDYFENILPENLILIDNFGGETLSDGSGTITPTFNDNGMNLLNWSDAYTVTDPDPDLIAVIMHKDCIGFEDNLNQTLFGPKDIEKLATPVRMHFWTKAYFTDLLPAIKIKKGS